MAIDLQQVSSVDVEPGELPATMAAGERMDVPTKSGPQRLRPVLGEMAEHPPHLPIAMQFPEWEARLEALRQAAPVDAHRCENSCNSRSTLLTR